jgi:hypothetical protein
MGILKNAGLVAGAVALLYVSAIAQPYADSVSVYTDTKDRVKGASKYGAGALIRDTVTGDAFEGKQCFKYSYNLNGLNWDAFGLNSGMSVAGVAAMRIAYKGLIPGASVGITLMDRAGGSTKLGYSLNESASWTNADYPITDFIDGMDSTGTIPMPVDFTKFASIRFDIASGTATATGDIFIDNIWFMGATIVGVKHDLQGPHAVANLTARSSGSLVTTVCNLNGEIIVRHESTVNAYQAISRSLGIAEYNQLAPGMYVVSLKGAGINVSYPLSR